MEQLTLLKQEYKRKDNLLMDQHFSSIERPKYQNIEQALATILPSPTQENKVIKARKTLGESGRALTDEQVKTITAEFQFLVDSWLDEFERATFAGKTLQDLLQEV